MSTIKTILTKDDFSAFATNPKGTWRAFKMTNKDGSSKRRDRRTGKYLHYAHGKTVQARCVNPDVAESCGEGIHIASLQWLRETRADGLFTDYNERGELYTLPTKVFLVQFDGIKAIIPNNSEGKFRVRRVKVLYRVGIRTGKRWSGHKKVAATRS